MSGSHQSCRIVTVRSNKKLLRLLPTEPENSMTFLSWKIAGTSNNFIINIYRKYESIIQFKEAETMEMENLFRKENRFISISMLMQRQIE